MKTARRHELQTNELAVQIGEALDFTRRNGKYIGGAVLVLIAGGFAAWFHYSGRDAERVQAWNEVNDIRAISAVPPAEQVAVYARILERGVDPTVSALALLRTAEVALGESADPKTDPVKRADWARQAEEVCQRIEREFADRTILLAAAIRLRGILAENRGAFDESAALYRRLVEEPAFRHLPIRDDARLRLERLGEWTAMVEFPPPLPTTVAAGDAGQPAGGDAEKAWEAGKPARLDPEIATPVGEPERVKELERAVAGFPTTAVSTPEGEVVSTTFPVEMLERFGVQTTTRPSQ